MTRRKSLTTMIGLALTASLAALAETAPNQRKVAPPSMAPWARSPGRPT